MLGLVVHVLDIIGVVLWVLFIAVVAAGCTLAATTFRRGTGLTTDKLIRAKAKTVVRDADWVKVRMMEYYVEIWVQVQPLSAIERMAPEEIAEFRAAWEEAYRPPPGCKLEP